MRTVALRIWGDPRWGRTQRGGRSFASMEEGAMNARSARALTARVSLSMLFAIAACDGSGSVAPTGDSSSRPATTTSSPAVVQASATGAGNTIVAGELRTFSFVALAHDGTTSGTA